MSKSGSWTATDVDSVIVPADKYRDEVSIQVLADATIWVNYGKPAVVGEGRFVSKGGIMTITDVRAQGDIHAICATGATASGGYDTV